MGARTSKADIGLIRESQPLGTAGALGLVPETLDEPILVLNGDVLTKTDFVALDAFHRQHGYDATIAVARHSVEIPYGIVRHDDGGAFRGIDEKPVLRNFVAAGIYYLSPAFVGLVAPNEATSMPALLNDGHRIGMRIGLFPIHEYWADIGRPEDLDAGRGPPPRRDVADARDRLHREVRPRHRGRWFHRLPPCRAIVRARRTGDSAQSV